MQGLLTKVTVNIMLVTSLLSFSLYWYMSTFVGFFTVHITLTPLEGKDGENRVGSGLQDHVSHIQQVMREVQVRTSETF